MKLSHEMLILFYGWRKLDGGNSQKPFGIKKKKGKERAAVAPTNVIEKYTDKFTVRDV